VVILSNKELVIFLEGTKTQEVTIYSEVIKRLVTKQQEEIFLEGIKILEGICSEGRLAQVNTAPTIKQLTILLSLVKSTRHNYNIY